MNYAEYLEDLNMGSVGFFDTSPAVCAFLDHCQQEILERLDGAPLPVGDEVIYKESIELYAGPLPAEDDLRERILSWAPMLDKLPPDDWAMYVADICGVFIEHSA